LEPASQAVDALVSQSGQPSQAMNQLLISKRHSRNERENKQGQGRDLNKQAHKHTTMPKRAEKSKKNELN
jgi:hypothetical protein